MKNKEKPKYNIFQNIIWMLKNAWESCRILPPLIIVLVVINILYELAALYIAPEILRVVENGEGAARLLTTALFFTAALFITKGVKYYISEYSDYCHISVRSNIISKIAYKSNTTSYQNTLKQDFIQQRAAAHMQCEGNQSATEHIWKTLCELLQNVCGFIIYLLIISDIDPVLIIVIIITCLISFSVSGQINRKEYEMREEENKYYTKKSYLRKTSESISIAKDIRIFGLKDWLCELLDKVHDIYRDYRLKQSRLKILRDIVDTVCTVARNGIAYVYLINMVISGSIDAATFVLYFAAVSGFSNWLAEILEKLSTLQKESLDINKVRSFLEYPEPFNLGKGEMIDSAEAYEIRLKGVSYRYPGAKKDTIHKMDLTIKAGEKLAIVGLNGAGKTTLVKLICGLIDPSEGRVLLNGVDIRRFDRKEYYRLFSAVFQEFSILDVTLAECITQSTEPYDEDKMRECIENAGLTDLIAKLSKGLETHFGKDVFEDGVAFSGGQTQRLMLARALYKGGALLILDEPTAALDPIAENDIYMKYDTMTRGKTSVFISHRLASTRFCDRILFLKDGAICEEGDHESLLSLGGEYSQLFEVQSRYYQEGKEF